MQKKIGILLSSLFIATFAMAQQADPVHFSYSVLPTGNKTYAVHITAKIEGGWHIYAQVQPGSAISVPTKIAFTKNPLVKLQGKTKELGTLEKQKLEEVGIEQNMYEKQVDFVQVIQAKANARITITGKLTYQACTDEMCLPPKDVPFIVVLE